jgi:lysophospholipase L1-like esterase
MAVLDAKYPKLITTFNGAQSGQQSRWGIQNVKTRVIEQKPDVVFIEFTTNDAVRRMNLTVDEARKNTDDMIDQILAANPNCQVILMTMNPTILPKTEPQRERVDLPAYEQMYREICQKRSLLLVDNAAAWKPLFDQGEEAFKKFVPDGVHPNATGFEKYVTPNVLNAIGVEAR